MMRRIIIIVWLGGALCGMSWRAAAQEYKPPEIRSRFDLNTFHNTSTPDDGWVLEHGEVLKSLQFGFTGTGQVDVDPLTWQHENEDGSYTETDVVVEHMILAHIGAAIGFFDYAQLAVHFPIYIDRGTVNSNGGVGDLLFVPKAAYRFEVGEGELGVAALIPLSVPTGDENRLMGEGGVALAPGIAADAKVGKLRMVLNAAYGWRKEEELDLVRGPEMLIGLGAELDILTSPGVLRGLLEVDMATQTGDFFGRASTPVCVLGGVKYRFERGIGLGAAIGGGVTPGVGNPDVRILLGVDFIYQKVDEEEPEAGPVVADSDGDGIKDPEDKCPEDPEDFDNYDDDDGCPEEDNDNDGILDSKDECPAEAENINGMDDDDGCPDFDTDKDGIVDSRDACPNEVEDKDGFSDRDGCPEEDNDLDGIVDGEDECPNLPESFNDYKDKDGCPDYFRVENDKLVFKRRIRFKRKEAELQDAAFDVIEELATTIISNVEWREVHITVHTSGRGNDEAQQAISEQRASTILRLLIQSGVVPERLVASGRGNSEQIAPADTPEGRRQNNRVEVEIKKGAVR
ncbi:MAG: OmpA family protein [Deltaproteobacteria bacterium]|nr:OmpA family protein [Deltaproteobacteria bacterium]